MNWSRSDPPVQVGDTKLPTALQPPLSLTTGTSVVVGAYFDLCNSSCRRIPATLCSPPAAPPLCGERSLSSDGGFSGRQSLLEDDADNPLSQDRGGSSQRQRDADLLKAANARLRSLSLNVSQSTHAARSTTPVRHGPLTSVPQRRKRLAAFTVLVMLVVVSCVTSWSLLKHTRVWLDSSELSSAATNIHIRKMHPSRLDGRDDTQHVWFSKYAEGNNSTTDEYVATDRSDDAVPVAGALSIADIPSSSLPRSSRITHVPIDVPSGRPQNVAPGGTLDSSSLTQSPTSRPPSATTANIPRTHTPLMVAASFSRNAASPSNSTAANDTSKAAAHTPSSASRHQTASPRKTCPMSSGTLQPNTHPSIDSVVAVTLDLFDSDRTDDSETDEAVALRLIAAAMFADTTDVTSEYHTFLPARRASMVVARWNSTARGADERRCVGVEDFKMDVVYTSVTPDSVSHQDAQRQVCSPLEKVAGMSIRRRTTAPECAESRFRDWGELQYSMRSVFRHGSSRPVAPPSNISNSSSKNEITESLQSAASRANSSSLSLIGNIHIVVAERDQTPQWLNTSFPGVRIVTHHEIFPSDVIVSALPTLNSFAIESVLHRIPDLRRFFVYFNNDMFWGRQLSFFDYFRPLSENRGSFRTAHGDGDSRCIAEHLPFDLSRTTSRTAAGSGIKSRRVTILFEPVLYFEKQDGIADRKLVKKRSVNQTQYCADVFAHIQPRDNTTEVAHRLLSSVWFTNATTAMFDLALKIPKTNDKPHKLANFNRRIVYNGYGVPTSHAFAHYPQLIDRDLLRAMLERDFAGTTHYRDTMISRIRSPDNLWMTMVYPYAALAHRRSIDTALAMQQMPTWQPESDVDVIANITQLLPNVDPENSFMGLAMTPHPAANATWLLATWRSAHPLPKRQLGAHAADRDYWLAYLGSPLGQQKPHQKSQQSVKLGAHSTVPGHTFNASLRNASNGTAAARVLPASSIMPLTASSSPQTPPPLTETDAQVQARALAHVTNSVALEKLAHHVVSMDGKSDPIYHFCMLKTTATFHLYQRELSATMKLFVTLNDDVRFPTSETQHLVRKLMLLISGEEKAQSSLPPWEQRADAQAAVTSAVVHAPGPMARDSVAPQQAMKPALLPPPTLTSRGELQQALQIESERRAAAMREDLEIMRRMANRPHRSARNPAPYPRRHR